MAKESSPSPPTLTRRTRVAGEESSQQQRRRSPVTLDNPGIRRRSSTLTDFSLDEARKTFKSSTDDILLPKVSVHGNSSGLEPSHWHSAPLAFALFPAIGGLLFKNGSSIITDVMLIGLAAIFLNWSVRLPWEWYRSAQMVRELGQYNQEAAVDSETEDENHQEASSTSLEDIEEDQCPTPKPPKPKRLPVHEAASNELRTHEVLALLSCFISPLVGTYLLHTIRSQLTRPSEGLVSNYNLTIFLLAAELRPLSHLVKLIQSRTLHLQRIVNTNPYSSDASASMVTELTSRLLQLESKNNAIPAVNGNDRGVISAKQINNITTSIRQTLQPDLDALNRAVRRYEKRATLQTMQTDSRLSDLESRLNDAISLAAAAANSHMSAPSFVGKFLDWIGSGLLLPIQGLASLVALPFKTLMSLISYGKAIAGQKESVDVRSRKGFGLKNPGYRGSTRSLKKA